METQLVLRAERDVGEAATCPPPQQPLVAAVAVETPGVHVEEEQMEETCRCTTDRGTLSRPV